MHICFHWKFFPVNALQASHFNHGYIKQKRLIFMYLVKSMWSFDDDAFLN